MTIPDEKPKQEKWYYQIWFIVIMLFVMGPFAFPLLWKSPKLSSQMKWVLTILIILLTLATFWMSAELIKVILKQAKEIQALLY